MTIELERRTLVSNSQDISALSEEVQKRALELSAYFTIPEMEPAHVTLALFSAMNFAHKNKQLSSALSFANSLIEKGTNTKFKENVSASQLYNIRCFSNTSNRPRRSKTFASAIPTTPSRSTMINSLTLKCAPPRTHRYMEVRPVFLAPTTVSSTTPSIRVLCARSAKSPRSALQPVACDCFFKGNGSGLNDV